MYFPTVFTDHKSLFSCLPLLLLHLLSKRTFTFSCFKKSFIIVNSSILLTSIACFVVYLFHIFVGALQFRQRVSCKHSSSAQCHVEAQHYDPPCNVNITNKIITGNFSMEET